VDWKKLAEVLSVPIIIFVVLAGITIYDKSWIFIMMVSNVVFYLPVGWLARREGKCGPKGATLVGAFTGCVYGLIEYFVSPMSRSFFNVMAYYGILGFILGGVGSEISTQKKLIIAMLAVGFIYGYLLYFS
jgi:hypothetical protein